MTDPGLPRIIGLLCWYDESPSWLAECVASVAGVVDHLIAVDGGYQFFPGAIERPLSRIEEADTIARTCSGLNIGLTLHREHRAFDGNEVEKRSLALDLAYNVAREQDWLLIFDADEVVRLKAPDLKEKLAETEFLVASYGLADALDIQSLRDAEKVPVPTNYESESVQPVRDLHRAVPGLHYEDAHYVLCTTWPDGEKKYFRGMGATHEPMVPCYDATRLLCFEHKARRRAPERLQRRAEYYRRRDSYGIERFHRYAMETVDGGVAEVKTHLP